MAMLFFQSAGSYERMLVAAAARAAMYDKDSLASSSILPPRLASNSAVALSTVACLSSAPAAALDMVPCALSATERASGSEIFSTAAFTSGSSLGITGTTAAGSSTTLHMLSTMRQHVRLTSSDLSLRPRDSTGNMMANAGVSTFCTKMQPASFSTHLCVLLMEEAASTTAGRKGSKSLFPVQPAIAVIAASAAVLTSFLMSQVSSATGEHSVTNAYPMAFGLFSAITEMAFSVASFVGGLDFTPRPLSRWGMTASMANGLMASTMALPAATAATATFLDLSLAASRTLSSTPTRNGSAEAPFSAAIVAMASRAPWASSFLPNLAARSMISFFMAAIAGRRTMRWINGGN
mmetsp:Transcript_81947/g.220253  ORF Transcript_81947/g.220253 Transcript_81947/m.220253 type:complete len:350 (+) Transcript_81947:170-1219(+)